MNLAIGQMDEVTQQNAALVEQAAAAAESMQEQTRSLTQAVAAFKVGHAAAEQTRGRDAEAPKKAPPARPTTERRGPNRAANVARLTGRPAKGQAAAKVRAASGAGAEEQWEEF